MPAATATFKDSAMAKIEINIAFDALEGFTGKETIEEATAILVSFIDTMLAEIL